MRETLRDLPLPLLLSARDQGVAAVVGALHLLPCPAHGIHLGLLLLDVSLDLLHLCAVHLLLSHDVLLEQRHHPAGVHGLHFADLLFDGGQLLLVDVLLLIQFLDVLDEVFQPRGILLPHLLGSLLLLFRGGPRTRAARRGQRLPGAPGRGSSAWGNRRCRGRRFRARLHHFEASPLRWAGRVSSSCRRRDRGGWKAGRSE
mmetsp:Transcript_15800/g.37538  ORF Transcript_15800/g.37538 Transcript_15800/m.37538 type:complete len:201 (+) Transcript_15800:505-1107(+)